MSHIDDLKSFIDNAQYRFGADSCTFYIQDPWWPEDLRLLFMPGVTIPEPMHGFLMPRTSMYRVSQGEEIELIDVANTAGWAQDFVSKTLDSLVSKKSVFGNFTQREKVKSFARLIVRDQQSRTIASLFLNFKTENINARPQDATDEFTRNLQKLLKEIKPKLNNVITEMAGQNPLSIQRLVRILDTTKQLASIGGSKANPGVVLDKFFRNLLQTVLDAYEINEDDGFGTIHLFDAQTESLKLEASLPVHLSIPKVFCEDGAGIVSWVALKGRPILITNMDKSEFKTQNVYQAVEQYENVQNEVALPMVVGDNVVGVLNIESRRENAFQPEDVRVLWYAANHAAVAAQLGQRVKEAQRTKTLLKACKDAVNQAAANAYHPDKCLHDLASLLADWTSAAMCDIWGYDAQNNNFWGAGASSRDIDLEEKPRELGKGFSRNVIQSEAAVWINEIASDSSFEAYRWVSSNNQGSWDNTGEFPDTISPTLASMNVKAEIGVPVISYQQVIGVAWLKYENRMIKEPTLELMDRIDGIVASIALVIEFLQKYDESVRLSEENFKTRLKEYAEGLFPLNYPTTRGLEIYVRSEPHGGTIGGDFYGFHEWPGQNRVGIILGDGASHGIEGALHMLPLYTAFRILCAQTTSTHYVLEKMNEVARDVNVMGSALYFIIDCPSDNEDDWILSASVAGDAPPLLLFDLQEQSGGVPWPSKATLNQTRFGAELPPPLGEALTKCPENGVIVGVTDGIQDAGVRDDNSTKFDRLGVINAVTSVLGKNRSASAKEIADSICEKARAHGTIHDDASVLVVRVRRKSTED